MEYPPVEVRRGKIRDCANVVFRCFSVEEVEQLLRRLGWVDVLTGHEATLLGQPPILQLQYPVVLEFLRYHMRLFRLRGEIVGNVHYNGIALQFEPPDLHKADHEKGLEFLKRQLEREGGGKIKVEMGRECNILIVDNCGGYA
ncbi:MAG: hypothetical protein ACO2PN_20395 [Pyrobaculum sp.]|jgi:hypothetical protein